MELRYELTLSRLIPYRTTVKYNSITHLCRCNIYGTVMLFIIHNKKNKSRKRAKRSYLLKCYVIGVIFSEAISESE